MTLIATFSVDGCPVVFGDLLITGETMDSRVVATPAAGEVQDFFGDSGWSVLALQQKVNIISDHCAIAWAGTQIAAQMAVRELRRQAELGTLTRDFLFDYLNNDRDLLQHNVSFVGLFHDGVELSRFGVRTNRLLSPSLGDTYYAGSGSDSIDSFSNLLAAGNTKATGSMTSADSAFARSLMLGGMLLNSEFRGGDQAPTIQNLFGGGYEQALFINRKMQKAGNVTYVFWEANLASDGVEVSVPSLVMKQQYSGALLLLRSVRMQAGLDGSLKLTDDQRHIIKPLFESDDLAEAKREISQMTLDAPLVCHCIAVWKEKKAQGVYTMIKRAKSNDAAGFAVQEQGDKLILSFTNEMMAHIANALATMRNRGLQA